jgi:hypothetical protein
MEESRASPHIIRLRPLEGGGEAAEEITTEGARALLVFADRESAEEFAEEFAAQTPGGFSGGEAVPVSPAEISEVCARHGIGLCALFSFVEPGDLSVVSVEALPMILEATE